MPHSPSGPQVGTESLSVSSADGRPPGDLHAALLRLDLRLRLAVDGWREDLAQRARDPFRGLYLSDDDVEALLAGAPESACRLLAQPPEVGVPRLAALARRFELDAVDLDALLICFAPEIDLRYERLYAYLQDDVTRRRPTVDLVLSLLTPVSARQEPGNGEVAARSGVAAPELRRRLGPGGRLIEEGLLTLSDEAAANWPLLARPLRVDERIVEYLLGSDAIDHRIAAFTHLMPADEAAPRSVAQVAAGPARLLAGAWDRLPPLLYLQGHPSRTAAVARAACLSAGRPLLLVDAPSLLASAATGRAIASLGRVGREAALQGAVLCLARFDGLLGNEADLDAVRAWLPRALARARLPMVLLGERPWEPVGWIPGLTGLRVDVPAPGPSLRLELWQAGLAHLNGTVPLEEIEALARYRLDEHGIDAVAAAAAMRAAARGRARPALEDVQAAARSIACPPLDGLATRLDLRYTWDDIVLPADGLAQLRELCSRARHGPTVLDRWGFGRKHARRSGLIALFAGPPGTGKTMAAEILANELGQDLYRVDLSAVVSKYIGETEKNLERIFHAADQGDAVLLFDEADALFGKRSEVRDAHDRYANVEIAYLLQRLEAYQGLAILTTNLRGNIDEAFLRRVDAVIEFPVPEEAERLAIWRRALPPEAPLAEGCDLAFLARKFKLAGGHIRNIALTAAFLAAAEGAHDGADAAIAMRHLVRATRREHQKLGKLVSQTDFERYFPLLTAQGPQTTGGAHE